MIKDLFYEIKEAVGMARTKELENKVKTLERKCDLLRTALNEACKFIRDNPPVYMPEDGDIEEFKYLFGNRDADPTGEIIEAYFLKKIIAEGVMYGR